MSRVVRREEGTIIEMHDRPCLTPEDHHHVKHTLITAGRQHPRLVIDCSAIEMLSATFLSAILVAFKTLGARPGDFVLCGLSPIPRQVFEITKLDRFFPIYETREEALRAPWPEPTPIVPKG